LTTVEFRGAVSHSSNNDTTFLEGLESTMSSSSTAEAAVLPGGWKFSTQRPSHHQGWPISAVKMVTRTYRRV